MRQSRQCPNTRCASTASLICGEREDMFTRNCAERAVAKDLDDLHDELRSIGHDVSRIPADLLPSAAQQGKLSAASWKSPASVAVPSTTSMTRLFPSAAQRSSARRAVISSRCDVQHRRRDLTFGSSGPSMDVKSSLQLCATCKLPSMTIASHVKTYSPKEAVVLGVLAPSPSSSHFLIVPGQTLNGAHERLPGPVQAPFLP